LAGFAMTIPYDAGALSGWRGLWRLFVRWRGTILSATIRGPLFWLSNVLHVGLLIVNGKLALGQWAAATNATTGETYFEFTPFFTTYELWQLSRGEAVIGLPLLFFFIVFYNNNSYQRFYALYSDTVGMSGRIMEWTALVKAYGPRGPDHRWAQWNAVRLMLAAQSVVFYSLAGDDAVVSADEWSRIKERFLLTEEEIELLQDYQGFKPFCVVTWALDEARALIRERALVDESLHHDLGQGMRDEHIFTQFADVAFRFRNHCSGIINLLNEPIPFPYFHLLNMMLLIQLMVLAYSMAATNGGSNPYFSIPVFLIVSIVLISILRRRFMF